MLFTSEQVSAGHPDKICDQISDAVVTDCLKRDRNSRVAVEALIKENHVVVAGEITSKHEPDIRRLVRSVLMFTEPAIYDDFDLQTFITRQSEDIALGVDKKGAGDQGSVFGYATNETHEMLPMPFVLATDAIERLDLARHTALGKDAKAQVTYDYRKKRIDTFLIGQPHRSIRHRWLLRRHRCHRQEADVRHLRWCGASWRRRFQWERPHQARPLRRVHGPEDCQGHPAAQLRREVRGTAGLRHWRGGAGLRQREDIRNRTDASPQSGEVDSQTL